MSLRQTTTHRHIKVLPIIIVLIGLQACTPMTKHVQHEYLQVKSYKHTSTDSLDTLGKKSTGILLLPLAIIGDILSQPVYLPLYIGLILSSGKLGC